MHWSALHHRGSALHHRNSLSAPPGFPQDPQGALNLHNQARAARAARALSWSPSLASSAQAYANRCVFQVSKRRSVASRLVGHRGAAGCLLHSLPTGPPPLPSRHPAALGHCWRWREPLHVFVRQRHLLRRRQGVGGRGPLLHRLVFQLNWPLDPGGRWTGLGRFGCATNCAEFAEH